MNANEILATLAIKYHGNWNDIYNAIKTKEQPTPAEKDDAHKILTNLESMGIKITCMLDDDYPTSLKSTKHPPFVIAYKGNLDLLKGRVVSICSTVNTLSDYEVRSTVQVACDLEENKCSCAVRSNDAAGILAHKASNELLNSTILILNNSLTEKASQDLIMSVYQTGGLILTEFLQDISESEANSEIIREQLLDFLVSISNSGGILISAGCEPDVITTSEAQYYLHGIGTLTEDAFKNSYAIVHDISDEHQNLCNEFIGMNLTNAYIKIRLEDAQSNETSENK